MSPMTPAGVVFDCDGTLADTEPISDAAWADVLGRYGYVPTDQDRRATVGRPYRETFAHFASRLPLGDPVAFRPQLRERFLARFDADLVLFDDCLGVLRELASEGVPVAVASSSSHAHVDRVLERAGVRDLVGAVVGADDVQRHKPEPEPYLTAAAQLGVPAAACAAVEDTHVGVASARSAGMYTVAVVRGYLPRAALVDAHRVVDRLRRGDLVRAVA